MISREEAIGLSAFSKVDRSVTDDELDKAKITISKHLINKIYDSIGSCGECEHLHKERCPCEGYADRNYTNFFCADFKRKDSCGTS